MAPPGPLSALSNRLTPLPARPAVQPTITRAPGAIRDRKILLESDPRAAVTQEQQQLQPQKRLALPAPDQLASFEELLEASGMLADRPPVPAGVTGHPFYTVQPMQLLSWYGKSTT